METLIPNYVEALRAEIAFLAQNAPHPLPVKSIFFGGGTPSLLTPAQFDTLMQALFDGFDIIPNAEISLESNPNDLTESYLKNLRSSGFNRISIGMQSSQTKDLQLFDRRHSYEEVVHAVSSARKAGFENLNLDLIYGNPYQELSEWRKTLEDALALQAQHFSLYALELKGGTPLRLEVDAGAVPRPDDDLTADMYELASELLAEHGYDQYEISNWCLPGRECRHNLQYWYNLPYFGLGAGAEGFAGGVRYSPVKLPKAFIERMNNPTEEYTFPLTPTVGKVTQIDTQTEMDDTIMMSMRLLHEGVNRSEFRERFGVDFYEEHRETLDKFAGYGIIEVDEEKVRLTENGRFLSNAVIRELLSIGD